MTAKPLAIVGDFNPENESHLATDASIRHTAAALALAVEHRWIGTEELAGPAAGTRLANFSGLWIAPASPYRSMEGALLAIRTAREGRIPLLGTCGGFPHMILEYARNVLGLADAEHEESAPGAPRLVISRQACSLVGQTRSVRLQPGTLVARIYGRSVVREQYRCNFGLNSDYAELFGSGRLRVSGTDDEGVVRLIELAEHPFFIGTSFVPQLSSTVLAPHPLIAAFIKACLHAAYC